jgi:hypothetical protein
MVKKESLKDIQGMKLKTTNTLSSINTIANVFEHNKSFQDIKDVQALRINKDITLGKLAKDIQDMSMNLGIEIEAKLRNVLYLLQDIDDDKAKKAFKIIDDLIY